MCLLVAGRCVWLANQSQEPNAFQWQGETWPGLLSQASAVIHTHPNGQPYPSTLDQAQQKAMGVPWLIVPRGGEPFALGVAPPPLVGRGFRWGVTDCLSLVADFYAQAGRVLPFVPHEWAFWRTGVDLFGPQIDAAGFRLRGHSIADAEDGDAILFRIRSAVWNHIGVYTDGKLLHHPGSLSPYDPACLSRHESIHRYARFPLGVFAPC